MQRKYLVVVALCLVFIICLYFGASRIRRGTAVPAPPTKSSSNAVRGTISNPELVSRDLAAKENESPAVIFEDWYSAAMKGDGIAAEAFGRRLGEDLRHNSNGNEAVYQRMSQIMRDPAVSRDIKLTMINMLTRVATPQVVSLFLELLQQDLPADLRSPLITALSQTGDYFWDKRFFPETATMLSNAWAQTRDPEMFRALANPIARMGGIDSLNQLLDSIANSGSTLADIQASNDSRAAAALMALRAAQNQEIAYAAAKRLNSGNNSIAEVAIYTSILASGNNVNSTRYLFEYAQNAIAAFAEPIGEAFLKISEKDSLEYLSVAVRTAQFKSNSVRTVVISSIKKP